MVLGIHQKNIKKNNRLENLDPHRFIDNIKEKKHSILFYEEPEYAKPLEFRFIKNGLLNGELCIYFAAENEFIESIEEEMKAFGIDVKKYKEENLLKILQAHNPVNILNISEKFFKKIKEYAESRKNITRVAVRWLSELTDETRIKVDLEIERYFQSRFNELSVIMLCSYSTASFGTEILAKYMKAFLHSHDSVIFAASPDKGIAYDLGC